MRKLLTANCRYFAKNKLFRLEIAFCILFSGWIMFANYSPKIQASADPLHLETPFFIMYQILSIVFASAISLIVGTEYSDGTLRNKLMIGHTRSEIYFSMLFTTIGASVSVIAVHGIVSYGVGYFLFETFQLPATQIIIGIVCALLANLVFTTLFVAVALNCSNKSISAVVSILSSIVIIVVANIVEGKLNEPEMTYSNIIITASGIEYGDIVQNPNYVTGITRKVYEFLYDFLPTGQLMQIQSLNITHWQYWAVLSIVLFSVITLIGYILFRKKDIK